MKTKEDTRLQSLLRKKKLFFWGAVLLTVLIAIIHFAFIPLLGEVVREGKNSFHLRMKLKESRVLIAGLEKLQKENGKLSQDLKEHKKQMAGEEEVSNLLDILLGASNKSGVDFLSLTPKGGNDRGRYQEIPFEMTIKTQYPGLVKFLLELEREDSLIRVGELSITASKTEVGEIEAQFKARCLFIK